MLGEALTAVAIILLNAFAGMASTRINSRRLNTAMPLFIGPLVDGLALLTIARVVLDIAPASSVVWLLLLWVPFQLGIQQRAIEACVGGMLAALGMVLASRSSAGALDEVEWAWGGLGIAVTLVLGATMLIALDAFGRRGIADRHRALMHTERLRAEQLRTRDELKNTFLSAVSHELRTPLTSILGFTMTLLDRTDLPEEQRELMLRTILSEAEQLEEILANLLDLDRLTSGKAAVHARDTDMDALVRDTVARAGRRADREVAVDSDAGVHATVDAAKVERIVENLVANALKYTPTDAAVTVALVATTDGVLIRVDDSGPGMSAELRACIFEPFQRGEDPGAAGTGIGLSIVDRFSRLHGGRAWVEERPGGGCRFQVFLPTITSHVPPDDVPVPRMAVLPPTPARSRIRSG
jgi:signal transduction histidine kinase